MASDKANMAGLVEDHKEVRDGDSALPAQVNTDSTATTPLASSPSPPVDEKEDGKKDVPTQEEAPAATASAVPPAAAPAQPPQAPKEKKSPFLLKPEYKTALRDFIVCHLSPRSSISVSLMR